MKCRSQGVVIDHILKLVLRLKMKLKLGLAFEKMAKKANEISVKNKTQPRERDDTTLKS